jgi:hypothetical protein
MYPLQERYKAMPLVDQFEKLWREEQNAYDAAMASKGIDEGARERGFGFMFRRRQQAAPSAPSVMRIIHKMYGSEFYPLGLVRHLSFCGYLLGIFLTIYYRLN